MNLKMDVCMNCNGNKSNLFNTFRSTEINKDYIIVR